MIRLFCGYEAAEAQGFHVFVQSVIARASEPVAVIPLAAMGLPTGSNSFTLSRFLIPYLCGFEGRAIFVDASDMALAADVAGLAALADDRYAVQVVQHPDYQTRHPVKYRGTPLECANRDYSRKNWASVMLVNCAHHGWQGMTPERIAAAHPLELLQFQFLADEAIGALPPEWNRLVDEGHPLEGAALLHWTAGIPGFLEYMDAPGAAFWRGERAAMMLED